MSQTLFRFEGVAPQGGSLHFMDAVIGGTTVAGRGRTARSELQGKAGESRPSGSQGHALRVAAPAASLDAPAPFAGRSPVVHSGHPAGAGSYKNEDMEQDIQFTGGELAVIHARRQADPDLSVPERGATGPVPLGQVMEPFERIMNHPDRNRLMAEFFKRHW